jgi:hypothetical protein
MKSEHTITIIGDLDPSAMDEKRLIKKIIIMKKSKGIFCLLFFEKNN